ncbi:hypothetical protein [Streptomyces sp. NRRL S-37]|uniref:hypothetical protein n=1 Tax=Streptomyces sp. NRRL S-37 TaxID=1463903 RepID=UPI0004C677CB|nr:hypothetical protein [Streptomyces sp. NRRL S-37]
MTAPSGGDPAAIPVQVPGPISATKGEPAHLRFLEEAAAVTGDLLAGTVSAIRAGRLGRGLWHPTGFATFEIAQVPSLGLVRVHFWPDGLRRGLPGHPSIHQHCFRLYSRVLAGEYRESQYGVVDPGLHNTREVPPDARRMRVYEVRPTGVMGKDELHETSEHLDVVPTLRAARFPAGTWHEVPVRTFHATPIARNRFCVTLAVLSLPVRGATDILLGQPGGGSSVNMRSVVTDGEKELMCHQFIAAADVATQAHGSPDPR